MAATIRAVPLTTLRAPGSRRGPIRQHDRPSSLGLDRRPSRWTWCVDATHHEPPASAASTLRSVTARCYGRANRLAPDGTPAVPCRAARAAPRAVGGDADPRATTHHGGQEEGGS
jgi:hypothetical protein